MRVARLLSLLVVGYVLLDIANPLMPGVVQLVHGKIQVVEADRARAGDDVHIPAALPPARLTPSPVPAPSPRPRRQPARGPLCRRRLQAKRPRPARPPAGEDH